jgi:hypothetical protein
MMIFFRSKDTEDGPGKPPDDERGDVVGVKSTANLVNCVAWCNERNSGAGELSVSCLPAADSPIEVRCFTRGRQLQGRVLDSAKCWRSARGLYSLQYRHALSQDWNDWDPSGHRYVGNVSARRQYQR